MVVQRRKSAGEPACVAPSSPDIANARLKAMRGERGLIGDSLHALGVRLGVACGGSFYYPSEDRSILECVIIPFYQLSQSHQSILFVGTDWYTHGYTRMFARKDYTTIDPNPGKARYGAGQHIVDDVCNIGHYAQPGSLDVVFLNGIIGWGLNSLDQAEKAFAACHRCLRKGGHLVVGWNDLPEHLPFRIEAVESLKSFRPVVFPPLAVSEHLVENEWRHTFGFFCK
jgi:SAM-dependent methyltransferase